MRTPPKPAAVMLPLTAMKYLYRPASGTKLVVELDVQALKAVNEPTTIDEMVAEARLEYAAGTSKIFSSSTELMQELNS